MKNTENTQIKYNSQRKKPKKQQYRQLANPY